MNFVKFDLKEKTLVCRNENLIPRVCCHYLKNKDKCLKHYEKNKNIVGFCECPYGFNTFFDKNNIYTCLIVKEEINSRLVENLKTKNQKLNDFSIFKKDQLKSILDETIDEKFKIQLYEDAFHDLGNITNLINSSREKMEECIKNQELHSDNESLRNLLALCELIKYRLDITNDIDVFKENDVKNPSVKLHKIFLKMVTMLTPTAKKKDCYFKLSQYQNNFFQLPREIYLAIYIIMENAIKYSVPESFVRILFDEKSPNETIVTVENKCNKIDEEDLEHLFERGYRGSNATSSGSGIGLSKAKQIFDKNKIIMSYEYKGKIDCNFFTVQLHFKKDVND